ncbi:hypothetical protein J6590_039805 [Homalodisca vitripennis]|nr:hypothetical protein J6590_095621 [Homalodisca vitripennis]KAG8336724.1 hypothetical protein J6590_039805 [Homalodisca vitripennis]
MESRTEMVVVIKHFITPRVAGCRLFVKYTDRQSPVLRSAMELATSSVKKFGVIRLLARLTSKFTVWKAERRCKIDQQVYCMESRTEMVVVIKHFITPRVAGCRLFVKYTDRQSPVLRSAMELATSSAKKFGVLDY